MCSFMYASGCHCNVNPMICPTCIKPRLAIAMGKGRVAKGKVAKSAKEDMGVTGKVRTSKAKAVHTTVHAMKKINKNKWA